MDNQESKRRRKKINITYIIVLIKTPSKRLMKFLCGIQEDGKINRSTLWSMFAAVTTFIVLVIAYFQFQDFTETTSAEFSHKIKNDLYTETNVQMISLFDDQVLNFKSSTDDYMWFELDTAAYVTLPNLQAYDNRKLKYTIFEVDALLQNFEDLSFYEKQGLIDIHYVYDAYAYYIEMLWENAEVQKYITLQRLHPHNSSSYLYFEQLYKKLKSMTAMEK